MKKAAGSVVDRFGNYYKVSVSTSAADTLTFQEWPTGYSIKDGYGFIIHKIKYRVSTVYLAMFTTDLDYLIAGVCTNNLALTAALLRPGVSDSIIDTLVISKRLLTDVGFVYTDEDHIHDFTNEPGGGKLVAPKPLYLVVHSFGLSQVIAVQFDITYTMVKLSEPLYRELYESMNPSA